MRTAWPNLIPASQIGYHIFEAISEIFFTDLCTNKISRSLCGASSRLPYPPTAINTMSSRFFSPAVAASKISANHASVTSDNAWHATSPVTDVSPMTSALVVMTKCSHLHDDASGLLRPSMRPKRYQHREPLHQGLAMSMVRLQTHRSALLVLRIRRVAQA